MRTGFAVSPGGLLLPYHLGVLAALHHNGDLLDSTPIAGSSAGAIAVATHGCGLSPESILDATVEISDKCKAAGGARGRLMPLLKEQMDMRIGDEQLATLSAREGKVGIAYKEIFPRRKAFLETEFLTRESLINAVCHSSTFPFFATNWPCALDISTGFPRLVVDGFFTVDRGRFGCPDLSMAGIEVEKTVFVSCFPQQAIRLDAANAENCICPEDEGSENLNRLFRLATESSSRQELTALYESGWKDAERWHNADSKQ